MIHLSKLAGTDRGVSVTVSYILNLAIATMLIGSLLMVTGGVVQDQQEETIHSELEVIGQQVAANLMGADRMVQAGGETVEVRSSHPNLVSGSTYGITIDPDESEIVLESVSPRVTVTISFTTTTDVESHAVSGGDLEIREDGGQLEVRSR